MAVYGGPEVVTDGLVLCLDAGNTRSYPGSGTAWTDLSGRGNNGTLTNGPTYSSANGGTIVLDGTNDYVAVANNTMVQVNNFTLEAWVYPLNNSENGHIIRKEGSYILSHYWSSSNKLGIWMQRTGGWESVHANITVPLNTWCNVVGTYDNFAVKIYYNGDQVASTSKSGTTRVTTNDVLINGAVSNSLPQNYSCSKVSIYNRALSAAEVAQNYAATRGRFGL